MPAKRKTRRTSRKRKDKPRKRPVTKRRVSKRSNGSSLLGGLFHNYVTGDPFKPIMYTRLRYTDNYTFTTGTAGVYGSEQIMRLNSIFDPDFTSGGHQPYGRDSLAILYNRYKVHACLMELVWTDPSEDGMVVAAQLQGPGGVYSLTGKTVNEIKEQPMSATRVVNNTGKQVVIMKQYIPIHKVIGITDLQFKADLTQYSATMPATPSLNVFARMSAASLRGNASATIICRATFTYYCQCYDRIVLSQS